MTWQTKKLGEVLEKIVGGGTPSKSNPAYWGGDIPWASVKDIKEDESTLEQTQDFITEAGLKNSSANLVPAGTLILPTRMGLGRVVRTKIDTSINQDLKALFPKKELDTDYLLLFLKSKAGKIIEKGSGATVSGIRLEHLKEIEIPLPTPSTQKEIVKMLDEKMGKIGEAKRLRAEDLADTEKILPQTLHEIFEEGKKNGWEEKEIKDVCEKVNNINPEKEFDDKFLYVDIASVYKGKGIVPYEIFTTGNIPSRARRPILVNDVLFALTRPYLKNIAIVEKEFKDAVASTGFSVMRAKKNILNPKYLYYVVNSDEFMCKIIPLQKGATYPAVSESQVFLQKITLPPLAEQQKIVTKLDTLSEKVRTLRDLQTAQLADLKSLERAYLREAFREELV